MVQSTEPKSGEESRLALRLPARLFALSLLVYLAVRLIALPSFPIYFFTDEAAQTTLAADLVRDRLRGGDKVFLPTYFRNGSYYNLGTSVYLQVLPYLLFGRSVWVTRGVSVLVSLLAAAAVGWMLRDFYKDSHWWSGVLVLSAFPAWFLHSRTAFETVVFVSFYAGTLYAYLLYRLRSPRYLYLTLLLAALAFYAYSPGQAVVAATGLLLLLSDARYHWQQRRVILKGVFLGLLLALPYLRFRLAHPDAAFDQLRLLDSYWLKPTPVGEKLARFASEYLVGLSPAYWFLPNERDLPRHLMRGFGHLTPLALPFAAIGLLVAVRRLLRPEHRLLLVALLAAPAGSALVGVGITRLLVLVVPAALLVALGLSWVVGWLERWRLPPVALSLGLFLLLAFVNFALLLSALRDGPLWYRDYGMGGMQYGARQIFPAIQSYLRDHPQVRIILSPTWANGTDVLARFFLGDPLPIQLGSVQGHLDRRLPLDEDTLFVTTPQEYKLILESPKFTAVRVEKILPYPDSSPGFYFVHLRYVDGIDAIFAAEQAQRRQLRSDQVEIGGEQVEVRYSTIDTGDVSLAFDGDPYTLMRTLEANPLVIELDFPSPREISGFDIIIGSANVRISARPSLGDSSPPGSSSQPGDPREYSVSYQGSVEEPQVRLDFDAALLVDRLRIEVLDLSHQDPAHVHVWEIFLY